MADINETLCISCARSCNRGCSWSDQFIPVKGWTATEHGRSYNVSSCPKYKQDDKHRSRPERFDTDACMALLETMLVVTRDDYIHGTRGMRRMIENDLLCESTRKLLQFSNTDAVIKHLRAEAKAHDALLVR